MDTSEMIQMIRVWLEQTYPGAAYATLVVRLGDDVPSVVLPVILPTA